MKKIGTYLTLIHDSNMAGHQQWVEIVKIELTEKIKLL